MLFSRKVALSIKNVLSCKKVSISVIGLEVPHVHVHLIPINEMKDANFSNKVINSQISNNRLNNLIKSTTSCNNENIGYDCAGVYGGAAYIDECENCVEGTTGMYPCVSDVDGSLDDGVDDGDGDADGDDDDDYDDDDDDYDDDYDDEEDE